MNKKLVLVSLLAAIMMIIPVYAELLVNTEITKNSIFLDEYARYNLTITNSNLNSIVLQIYSTDVTFASELEPSMTRIGAGETLNLELRLIPTAWANTGAQGINVVISSPTTGEQISLELPVYLKTFDQIEKQYNPSVQLKVSFPETVDPREEIPINIYLRNRNKLNIEAMEIIIYSKLFNPEKRVVAVQPYPNGESSENIIYRVDPFTPPSEDSLEVILKVANKTINMERIPYKILGYSTFTQTKDTVEELFKTSTEYVIVNEGNMNKEDSFKVPTSLLRRIFTSTSPSADKVNLKQEAYIEWNLNLAPKEEIKIKVVENYRPIIYLILLGVVITLIYFLYRSPLIIKKETIIIGTSTEGISDMKVLLHIRNRSQDIIEHIKITDLIPSIAEIAKEANIGTLSPQKIIRNDRKGTIVKWELEALEPFEERIISYRLKSKIAIVGGLTLPPAKIKFDTKKGKERTVRSNKSQVSLGI